MAEPVELNIAVGQKAARQDYRPSILPDGVRLIPLRRFTDDGGSFQELVRLVGGVWSFAASDNEVRRFEVKQANYCVIKAGGIKAWHMHKRQTDLWFVPPEDKGIIGLLDCRKGADTQGMASRIPLGDGKSELLLIPPGVAHGYSNPYRESCVVIYFTDQQFDREDPDEWRLPFDYGVGKEFWEMRRE